MIIADTNEFHPLTDGKAYHNSREKDGSNHPYIIMRATYGTSHVDLKYGSSLKEARDAGIAVGHYGYMVGNLDAAAQGHFFAQTVKAHGGLRRFDTIWCDDEEGTGNQVSRVKAFLHAAHVVLNDDLADEGVYSGAAFFNAHGLGNLSQNVLRWVAAYGQANPSVQGQDLWQFADNYVVPGVQGPCDASIFNGNIDKMIGLLGADGPFRHVVPRDYKLGIDGLAKRRNWNVEGLIGFSLAHTNAEHQQVIKSYMDLRAALRDINMPSPVLPYGFVFYTVNP